MMRPGVVFDCNVFLQAIANNLGPSGQALNLLESGAIDIYLSRSVVRELRSVLQYPTVRQKLPGLDDQRVEAFVRQLAFRATFVRDVPHTFDYPRAVQDEPYINLAIAAKATHLVSRDKDILALATDHTLIGKEFRRRCPHLKVLNPVAFLDQMRSL